MIWLRLGTWFVVSLRVALKPVHSLLGLAQGEAEVTGRSMFKLFSGSTNAPIAFVELAPDADIIAVFY